MHERLSVFMVKTGSMLALDVCVYHFFVPLLPNNLILITYCTCVNL